MENPKFLDLCLKYRIVEEKYKFKFNEIRIGQSNLLKQKHIKKLNNFLYKFFNLKNNPNYIIESSLNDNIKVFKIIANKNIPVIEIDLIKNLNSDEFSDFSIRIKSDIIKDNSYLEKIITLGKISKILFTKKDIFLKKYNNYISNYYKSKKITIYLKLKKLSLKLEKLSSKLRFYRFKHMKNMLFSKKGLSIFPSTIVTTKIYPNQLHRIDNIKCNYKENKNIKIVFKSKEYNKKYIYNISQKLFDEIVLTIYKNIGRINNFDDKIANKIYEHIKNNLDDPLFFRLFTKINQK